MNNHDFIYAFEMHPMSKSTNWLSREYQVEFIKCSKTLYLVLQFMIQTVSPIYFTSTGMMVL